MVSLRVPSWLGRQIRQTNLAKAVDASPNDHRILQNWYEYARCGSARAILGVSKSGNLLVFAMELRSCSKIQHVCIFNSWTCVTAPSQCRTVSSLNITPWQAWCTPFVKAKPVVYNYASATRPRNLLTNWIFHNLMQSYKHHHVS
jgi:hypothetical protein